MSGSNQLCWYNQTQKKNGYVKPAAAVVLSVNAGVLGNDDGTIKEFPASGRVLPKIDAELSDEGGHCTLSNTVLGDYQCVGINSNVLNNVAGTLSGVGLKIHTYNANGTVNNAGVLGLVGTLVDGLLPILQGVITSVLSPLLDPLVNLLLEQLGLDLGQTQVAAQMTCNSEEGVRLLN